MWPSFGFLDFRKAFDTIRYQLSRILVLDVIWKFIDDNVQSTVKFWNNETGYFEVTISSLSTLFIMVLLFGFLIMIEITVSQNEIFDAISI